MCRPDVPLWQSVLQFYNDVDLSFGGICALRDVAEIDRLRRAYARREVWRWQLRIPAAGAVEGLFAVALLDATPSTRGEAGLMLELSAKGPVTALPG